MFSIIKPLCNSVLLFVIVVWQVAAASLPLQLQLQLRPQIWAHLQHWIQMEPLLPLAPHPRIPWLLRPGFVFVFWGIILWRLWRWCQTFCNLSRRIVLIFVRSWPKYEEMHSAACKNRRNPSVFMVWLHVRSQGSPLSALEQSEESATALPGRFVWFSAEALGSVGSNRFKCFALQLNSCRHLSGKLFGLGLWLLLSHSLII